MSESNILNKIETTFDGWLKPMPHLPENGRKWIASNVWWIVIIGLVLSIFAVLSLIGSIFTLFAVLNMVDGYTSSILGSAYGSFSILAVISAAVAVLSSIAIIILFAMAIKPLKAMDKKGWNLLFGSSLLSVTLSLISNIVNFNIYTFIPGLIGLVIGLAISMYFLFEIRSYFVKGMHTKEAKIPKVPQPAK